MTTREEYLDKLRRFKDEHGAEYGITRMGIFGSVARGEHTEDSDVDVLVEAPVLSYFSLAGIMYRLQDVFGKSVDVVPQTEYMEPRFKARIEKDAIYV